MRNIKMGNIKKSYRINAVSLSVIFLILTFALHIFVSPLAAQNPPGEDDWLKSVAGDLEVDQTGVVENLEDFSLPLMYLETYLASVLPQMEEPGEYRVISASEPEGLFEVQEIEHIESQFEDQPETWQEGDEWVWTFHDDERFVEMSLEATMIDYVEEPGLPLLSRIEFELDYAAPHLEISGIVRVRDDLDDVDLILDLQHAEAKFSRVTTDINVDLLELDSQGLQFEGDIELPPLSISGTHHFIYTEVPRDLPRTQPLYLDEYIFKGFLDIENVALEGEMWICTESVVMNGYTVIN